MTSQRGLNTCAALPERRRRPRAFMMTTAMYLSTESQTRGVRRNIVVAWQRSYDLFATISENRFRGPSKSTQTFEPFTTVSSSSRWENGQSIEAIYTRLHFARYPFKTKYIVFVLFYSTSFYRNPFERKFKNQIFSGHYR